MVAIAEPAQTFDRLWHTYQPSLRQFVLRRTGNAEDADDIVQEVFLSAWRVRETLRPDTIRAWFYACATNRVRDRLRKAKRAGVSVTLDEAAGGEAWPGASETDYETPRKTHDALVLDDDSDRGALTEEETALVNRVLQALPTREAAALTIRDLVGADPRSGAAMLGVSLPVFKKALWLARGHFRSVARELGADAYWADRYDTGRTGVVDGTTAPAN